MPKPVQLAKAELREIKWSQNQDVKEINHPQNTVKVQFNPETLKVSFANKNAGGDQRGGSAVQFVGAGTTKLSLELWFDVSLPQADGKVAEHGDVRKLTERVAYFIKPKKKVDKKKWIPAGVRFLWGTFKFDGVVDSLDESLEYFSDSGKPLRASVALSISSQMIQFQFGDQQPPNAPAAPATPGQQTLEPSREGETLQGMAGRSGKAGSWKDIARANEIEDPLRMPRGTPINMNPPRSS